VKGDRTVVIYRLTLSRPQPEQPRVLHDIELVSTPSEYACRKCQPTNANEGPKHAHGRA
jgi:hypothetical protein